MRGVPAGWGEPCFDKLEALLAHAMLSIPATKGFEIGMFLLCCNRIFPFISVALALVLRLRIPQQDCGFRTFASSRYHFPSILHLRKAAF